jgi:hypothetical protein
MSASSFCSTRPADILPCAMSRRRVTAFCTRLASAMALITSAGISSTHTISFWTFLYALFG